MRITHFLLTIPLMAVSTSAARPQVLTAGAAAAAIAAPHIAAALPAILTGALTAGSAHVGQAVIAKMIAGSVLSDGTKLPVGTQILGHVTKAVPVFKGGGKSSLSMIFDRFRTPDGQEHQLASSILKSVGNERDRHHSKKHEDDSSQAQTEAPDASQPPPPSPTQTDTTTTQTSSSGTNGHVLGGVANGLGEVVNGLGDTVVGLVGALTSLPGILLDANGTLVSRGRNVSVPAGTQVTIVTTTQVSPQQQ